VQISVLLGLFVLAKAADYWLDRYDLVNRRAAAWSPAWATPTTTRCCRPRTS
jgi:uncharacterized membrane protein (UPF0182 family)